MRHRTDAAARPLPDVVGLGVRGADGGGTGPIGVLDCRAMRFPAAACALAALFPACSAATDGGAASSPAGSGPELTVPAAAPTCNAGSNTGRVVPGRDVVLLQRTLDSGDLLIAELQCEPPDAVVLVLEGPLRSAGADGGTGAQAPDAIRWTEFPRPLPPGVETCPASGCGAHGGAAWIPPHLEHLVAEAGDYVLRLAAPEHPATCSVCLRLE